MAPFCAKQAYIRVFSYMRTRAAGLPRGLSCCPPAVLPHAARVLLSAGPAAAAVGLSFAIRGERSGPGRRRTTGRGLSRRGAGAS